MWWKKALGGDVKGLVLGYLMQAMCYGSGPSGQCAKGSYGLRKWSLKKILSLEW